MRTFILGIVMAGMASVGCGGDASPQDLCDDGTVALCGFLYECLDAAQLAAAGYPATEAACVDEQGASCESNTGCDPGETFNADKAEECIDEIDALTCTDQLSTPACTQVCT